MSSRPDRPLKICVVGAGAIGGILTARLARAGHTLSAIARGAHLEAIRANGLTLRDGTGTFTADVTASDNADDLEAQDFVIITVKAPALPGVAPPMRPRKAHQRLSTLAACQVR